MEQRSRWLVLTIAILVVVYGVLVLGFVATSPDLRLRCLLTDDHSGSAGPQGVKIQAVQGIRHKGPHRPAAGDVLLRIGPARTHTFIDFTREVLDLRHASIPAGWTVDPAFDPAASAYSDLPWIFAENETGRRWVEIEYRPAGSSEIHKSWLLVQSVPLGEILLTFVWLVLQLVILAVGALAYWYRPFDRPARLFFVMGIVALGAFVGGFHWPVVFGSLVLTIPFAACAILLPAVALHFFLVFPRTLRPMVRHSSLVTGAVYAVPVIAIAALLVLLAQVRELHSPEFPERNLVEIERALHLFRTGIYWYLRAAAAYFVLSLAALVYSYATTRNPLEQNQVKWILRGALLATVPIGWSLYLAQYERVEFALGGSRIPMFVASMLFMVAYAVGIVQHKLMLIDQIISRGMLYYVVSGGLTLAFSLLLALASVANQFLHLQLSTQQILAVVAILMLFASLLLWFRDLAQQMIDRQFFREKYQLDRAFQRMNQAIGKLVDPESLAQMMLGSCRDVLRVDRAALYLRTSSKGPFTLVAAENAEGMPGQFAPQDEFAEALEQGGSLQRVTPGTRSGMSPVQNQLRELRGELVHPLRTERGTEGLVVLGEKRHGGPFTAEDLTFLNALGQITNVALHSAKIHQDMGRLNEELRLKSTKITDQKRQIAMLQAELISTSSPAAESTSNAGEFRREAIKGSSPAIETVLETVRKVATSESSVLIRGESGTGKELLAQVLHENSPRRDGPIVAVHCASLSAGLLESELFGHVKGAFTGAHRDRVGRFEAANGGTLFLDEIGDISPETQVKLLRVLQERCFEPVGGSRTVHVDVRLITATHQNLERLISEGKFREDLYYRLNVISVVLPPLRERGEDIFELALYFLQRSTRRTGKRVTHLDDEALSALQRFHWPGNIRQLENVIERAVVLAEDDRITTQELPAEILRPAPPLPRQVIETKPVAVAARSLPSAGHLDAASSVPAAPLDAEDERGILLDALHRCGGNKARAARMLGMPRSTYFSKLKKYGIE